MKRQVYLAVVSLLTFVALSFAGEITVSGKANVEGRGKDGKMAARSLALKKADKKAVNEALTLFLKDNASNPKFASIADAILVSPDEYISERLIVKDLLSSDKKIYIVSVEIDVNISKIQDQFKTVMMESKSEMGNPSIAFVLTTYEKKGEKSYSSSQGNANNTKNTFVDESGNATDNTESSSSDYQNRAHSTESQASGSASNKSQSQMTNDVQKSSDNSGSHDRNSSVTNNTQKASDNSGNHNRNNSVTNNTQQNGNYNASESASLNGSYNEGAGSVNGSYNASVSGDYDANSNYANQNSSKGRYANQSKSDSKYANQNSSKGEYANQSKSDSKYANQKSNQGSSEYENQSQSSGSSETGYERQQSASASSEYDSHKQKNSGVSTTHSSEETAMAFNEELWKKKSDATIIDAFQQEFKEKQFDIMAADKAREIALASSSVGLDVNLSDRASVRTLAEKEGANYVARGEAMIISVAPSNGSMKATVKLGIEIVDVNSGDIVASYSNTASGINSSKEEAIVQAIKKNAILGARTLADQTLSTWSERAQLGQQYSILLENITSVRSQQRGFKLVIEKSVEKVISMTSPTPNTYLMKVMFKGSKGDLENAIFDGFGSNPVFAEDKLDGPFYGDGAMKFVFK